MGAKRRRKEATKPPDLNLVLESFSKCRRKDGTLSTDHYLCACNELITLLRTLGRGFRLALNDVSSAIRILEIRRVSCAGSHCDSLETMLESEYGFLPRAGEGPVRAPVKYGTHSLMTLYYSLEFILKFLASLLESFENNKPFKWQDKAAIYQSTLGWSQSQFQQTAIRVALINSGGRRRLLRQLEPSCHGVAPVCTLLQRCIEAARPIQRRVGELFGIVSDVDV